MRSTRTPGSRACRFVAAGTALAISLGVAACGTGGPPPTIYVLGTPAPAIASTEPLTGRPVIEVKRVLVPDYLDVSDIMIRRSANVLAPSPRGRWGERLSVGVTRALAFDLARQLPDLVVTTTPVGTPALQVLVEIEDFTPRPDGTVVLLARWRVLDDTTQRTLAGECVSLTDQAAGSGDAAIAAAMTRELDKLAGHVAAGVTRAVRQFTRGGT